MTTEATISSAPSPADDEAAIRATVDDYCLGWFDADGDRMARALHPDLAKRGWLRDPAATWRVEPDTRASMVQGAAAGAGRRSGADERRYTIEIHGVFGDIATAVVLSQPYMDYLHLVRTAEGWRILNVLWCPAGAG